MTDKAVQTVLADRLKSFKEDFVPKVAALRRPVLGNVTVSKDERRRRWWQEEKDWTPEHELMLLTAMNPDGTPLLDMNGQPKKPLSREDVGLLRFPNRELDAKAFGRSDPRRESEYARDMSALGPPDLGPLEQAAQDVQPPEPTPSAAPMAEATPLGATGVPGMEA